MKWLLLIVCCALTACRAESNSAAPGGRAVEPGVMLVGRIAHPRITESSGLVASRKDPNVFWTHNDGGGKRQVLYAISREGKSLGEFRISGAAMEDWEDIAADSEGNLFLADTGNNDAKPHTVSVHRVAEPSLSGTQSGAASINKSWALTYPAEPFDCEALFVLGESGYLISKVSNDARAGLYRFSLSNNSLPQKLEALGELRIDSPVTGADVSRDGRLLAVVAKNGAYVFRIDGNPAQAVGAKSFHNKFKHDHVEACAFVPEGLLATAESREIFLFTDEPFRTGPRAKR